VAQAKKTKSREHKQKTGAKQQEGKNKHEEKGSHSKAPNAWAEKHQ
jgi:hypothetical protein